MPTSLSLGFDIGNGSNVPSWAFGTDLWADFTKSPTPGLTDTHTDSINGQTASGLWVPKAANQVCRTDLGLQTTPTQINLATFPRDFTNAAWVKVSITAALTSVGIDGASNAASRLTATGAAGTALQTIMLVSASRTFAVWIKRITGSGTVSISQDGAAWTDITSQINSSTYSKVTLTATQLNPVIGFQITTSGDAVDVDAANLVAGAFVAAPLYGVASVAGNRPVISGLGSQLALGVAGIVQFNSPATPVANAVQINLSDGTINNRVLIYCNGTNFRLIVTVGGVGVTDIDGGTAAAGLTTVAFAASAGSGYIRQVGGAQVSGAPTYPVIDSAALGGLGHAAVQNSYQFTKKLALKFGAQNATTFAAMYAKAVLAAAA